MLGRSALLAATNSGDIGWQGAYSNVSLLLRNGTPSGTLSLDESLRTKTITAVGNASVTTAVARWNQGSGGSSLAFDGNGDWFTSPSDSAFSFGTGDFTVEMWVYLNELNRSHGLWTNGPTTAGSFGFYVLNTNKLEVAYYVGPTITCPTSLQINTWHHVAVTRQNSVTRVFLDGALEASNSTGFNNTSSQCSIGDAWVNSGTSINGYIDDLRITKGIARYIEGTGANDNKMVFAGTNNFADPNAFGEFQANISDDQYFTSISLLMRGNQVALLNLFDESPSAPPRTITAVGNALATTAAAKWNQGSGGSSLAFDGSGDYLLLDGSSDFVFGINDFTIEMWAYVNSPGNIGVLYDSRPFATTGIYPMIYFASNAIRYQVGAGDVIVSSTVPLGAWIHIALCRASNSTRLFINGIQNGNTYADTNNYLNGGSGRPVIGANGPNLGLNNFNGYIDDLRVTKGIARYTSNFTPPPAELPNF